jgi:outer membrane cobalamin receptor
MKFLIMLFLCLIPYFLNSQVQDSTSTPKTRHYFLEGIRVIAEKPQEAIGSIDIKEFDAKLQIPHITVSETLQDVSGLSLSTGGKSGTDLSIRGFANDEIKFMLDGRPLGGGYFGNVDLNTIQVSDIKEIRIIKGPVSSLYGSDTMGGVVNIITRSADNSSWLKTGFLAERNNTSKIYLSSSRDFGLWDYSLYASRYHTDGFMLSADFQPTVSENGLVRNFTSRNQWDFQSKINFSLLDFHSIGIQVGYTFMDKKQIPSSIYENSNREFLDWKRMQLSGMGFFQLNDFLTADFNVYYDQYDDTYAEFNPSTGEMYSTWPSYLESWILGVKSQFDWELTGNIKAILGHRYEKQLYNRKDNGNYQDWTSNYLSLHNGFLQTEISGRNFNFSFGSGISFFHQKSRDTWIWHLEPSVGIYWKKEFSVSLAYSANTKYPNLHELFSSSSGNTALREERAGKTELNLEFPFTWNKIYGSISPVIFYNQITGLIDKQNDQYINLSNINTYGFELEGKLHWLWEHRISYSCIEYTDPGDIGLMNIPRHTVTLGEKIALPWQIKMEYKASWKDVRLVQEDNFRTTLPSYWLHSVHWNKSWKNYKFRLGIENIFDKDYQDKYGYPGAGVNFLLGMEAELF